MDAEKRTAGKILDVNNHDCANQQRGQRPCRRSALPVMPQHIREEGSGCAEREREHQDGDDARRVEEGDAKRQEPAEHHDRARHLHDHLVRGFRIDVFAIDIIGEDGTCT